MIGFFRNGVYCDDKESLEGVVATLDENGKVTVNGLPVGTNDVSLLILHPNVKELGVKYGRD